MGSYWGSEFFNTGTAKSESLLRLKYKGGAMVQEQLFTGAVAVIRGTATAINRRGKPIPPILVVICRHNCFNGVVKQFHVGMPVEAIDSGSENSFLILCKGAESTPIIAKSICRPIGKCADADERCGHCCNRKKN